MDNYEFAVSFEHQAKQELIYDAQSSMEKKYIELLFDRYLCIEPVEERNQLIHIDMKPHDPRDITGVSSRISNIKLNLREALLLAIESALALDIPNDASDYIKLALSAVLKVYILSRVKLDSSVCKLLLYLHENNAYEVPIPENKIYLDIDKGLLDMNRDEYHRSIHKLEKLASVVIINGEIVLNERIVLKY